MLEYENLMSHLLCKNQWTMLYKINVQEFLSEVHCNITTNSHVDSKQVHVVSFPLGNFPTAQWPNKHNWLISKYLIRIIRQIKTYSLGPTFPSPEARWGIVWRLVCIPVTPFDCTLDWMVHEWRNTFSQAPRQNLEIEEGTKVIFGKLDISALHWFDPRWWVRWNI